MLISPDGSLQLDGQAVGDRDLKTQLTQRAGDPKFQLQVEADENLKYGRLAEVMALAQAAGVTKLSFVTVAKNK